MYCFFFRYRSPYQAPRDVENAAKTVLSKYSTSYSKKINPRESSDSESSDEESHSRKSKKLKKKHRNKSLSFTLKKK